jgi:hypothetical protein
MIIPDGYQDDIKEKFIEDIDPKSHCFNLTRAIYGLVQTARQWWKMYKDFLACV